MRMKKRTILAFAVLAIVAPILIDRLIFGNSVPSNISNEAWASFLGSYIGGLCTLIALVATIHYYKESDKKKEKAAIQPFLHVTVGGNDREQKKGFSLPGNTKKDSKELKEVKIAIKNIGNGFASILVIHTGANLGGLGFKRVITVGESIYTFFMVDPEKLEDGLHFALQFVDAMRNEYIQEYEMKRDGSHILIDCGYPAFLEQR